MLFSRRKIAGDESASMRVCPIESIRPFFPMPAPVYVLLSGNDKFVSIKAPLDFFTPQELERFKPMGAFFYPDFIKRVIPFRNEALQFKTLLLGIEEAKKLSAQELEGTPAPFEVSDAFLRMSGKMWSEGGVIEPFFAAVFVHELCEALPEKWMIDTYSKSVLTYEQAILRSGWATWQAMHLGYLHLGWLNQFRNNVFKVAAGLVADRFEARRLLPDPWMREEAQGEIRLTGMGIDSGSSRAEKAKLWSKGERLRTELIQDKDTFKSIFGPGGFRDG
jgi:hypothetical protein